MPHLEPGIGVLRFGYSLNPLMCGMYPLEHSSVYGMSQLDKGLLVVCQGSGQMLQLHHEALFLKMPRIPAIAADRPMLYSHTCGPKIIHLMERSCCGQYAPLLIIVPFLCPASFIYDQSPKERHYCPDIWSLNPDNATDIHGQVSKRAILVIF